MRYTLRQLEVFVSVGRYESVSRAAVAVALSQSATSTALGEFERQFDSQLFDRVGKTLRLNELGRQLLPKAVELLDRAREIEELMEGKAGFGALQIGATLTIGNYLAALIIASFLRRHPESRVRLQVHNTATIVHQVVHHELALGLIEGDCHHPDLEVQSWVEDELVVFCAPDYTLARQGSASLEELVAQPWLLREHGSGTRETFDHALRHDFQRGSLVAITTPELDLRRQFRFLRHKQKHQTAAMREFLVLCRSLTEGIRRSDEIPLARLSRTIR